MGLYNMLFGQNANAETLLSALGLSRDDFYRFRDCYIEEDGETKQIAVYTRAGGSNSECEEAEEVNENMSEHALFVERVDDDFDCTYCTYYFRIPEGVEVGENATEPSRDEVWTTMLDAMKSAGKD